MGDASSFENRIADPTVYASRLQIGTIGTANHLRHYNCDEDFVEIKGTSVSDVTFKSGTLTKEGLIILSLEQKK